MVFLDKSMNLDLILAIYSIIFSSSFFKNLSNQSIEFCTFFFFRCYGKAFKKSYIYIYIYICNEHLHVYCFFCVCFFFFYYFLRLKYVEFLKQMVEKLQEP